MTTVATIVIPTRSRPDYLDTTLESIAPQAQTAGAEVIVVDDGANAATRAVVERHGARYLPHPTPLGPNAARNSGISASDAPLVVLVDDDVQVPTGWLATLLDAAAAHPDVDVFGGPITPRLERSDSRRWHDCGREPLPITSLDLGRADRDAPFVWSANMAIRRAALERVGPFDASYEIYGDEEEWQRRHRAAGGRIRYIAAAGLAHRRAGADARLGALCAAAYRRGRNSRRFARRKGDAPPLRGELRTLVGCVWHMARWRCANGVVMTAAAAGRLLEALAPRPAPDAPAAAAAHRAAQPSGHARAGTHTAADFLSGTRGTISGRRAVASARMRDLIADALAIASGQRRRLARAAATAPPRRRLLVLGIERLDHAATMAAARRELERSRHDIRVAIIRALPGVGKFERLNAALAQQVNAAPDWLLIVDDDVELPQGFLDGLIHLAERFDLALAQPAHRFDSHAAWPLTRRRPGSLVRETAFVEIGPVTLLRADTFATLLPFPDLRMGWGLDAHWAALAQQHGWRLGIVDALPIGHRMAPVAAGYAADEAEAEGRAFLAERPYLDRNASQRTLAVHRRLRGQPNAMTRGGAR